MKVLNSHIKNNSFINLYLLHGTETYLKKFYENKFKEKILPNSMEMMNFDYYEGKNINVETIENSIQTLPFMSEKRLIIVKNSSLFATGRKDDTIKMCEIISDIPKSTILVFIEENIDKRNSLFKQISKLGHLEELNTPKESELIDWIIKLFKPYEIQISKSVASFLIRTVPNDMLSIEKEVIKLVNFKEKGSIITEDDINTLCTKSLETRVFDLIDAIANKNTQLAINMYRNLITLKESPIMILSLIYRQIRLIFLCSQLEKTHTQNEIAEKLGIKSFVVNSCVRQSKKFQKETLLQATKNCLETDLNIKRGKISDVLGVEMLLISISESKNLLSI